MKTIKILGLVLLSISASISCTNLDEEIYSQIPKSSFFESEEMLTSYAGRAYSSLQGYGSEQSLWTLNIQVSDECAAPVNHVNDWTNVRYKELQTHKFPASNKLIRKGWDYCFDGIAACNDVIYEVERSDFNFDGKDRILSEIKVLRAYFYMHAMDGWGNIPFSINPKDQGYPEQKDRQFIFDFIIDEITECIDNLSAETTSASYGKVTQGAANAILAKMYLNAEEWIGKPMWSEAEKACQAIMDSGEYIIEDDYKANFLVNNEGSGENIFVIPYSTIYTQSDHNDFVIFILTLGAKHSQTYNIPATCWDGIIASPDFFNTYDKTDKRLADTWLFGQQYDLAGLPIEGYILNPDVDEAVYSTGKAETDGARIGKWEYQTDGKLTSDQTSMDNDFALIRYADVVLMWTEALVRQDRAGEAASNVDLQKIRTRASLAPFTAAELTLDNILKERGAELACEGWRRQDLIRFGKFQDAWWAKPNTSPETAKLYPIPTDRLSINPNLKQNAGY